MEEWRTIPSSPNYEASSLGNIRRVRGRLACGALLKPRPDKDGYLRVTLYPLRQPIGVHIIVCEAFHGPKPSPYHHAAHRDGCNQNNLPTNLRWRTPAENVTERGEHGRNVVGERQWESKLTEADVLEIRAIYAENMVGGRVKAGICSDLALRFNVHYATICDAAYGRNWKHL